MRYDNFNYTVVKATHFYMVHCVIRVFIYFDNAWDITCTFIGNIYLLYVIYDLKSFYLSLIYYIQSFVPCSGPIVNINNSVYFLENITVCQFIFVYTNPYYFHS